MTIERSIIAQENQRNQPSDDLLPSLSLSLSLSSFRSSVGVPLCPIRELTKKNDGRYIYMSFVDYRRSIVCFFNKIETNDFFYPLSKKVYYY